MSSTSVYSRTRLLLILSAMLVIHTACSKRANRSSSTAKPAVCIKVVQIVFSDGWKTIGDTTVYRDGKYRRVFQHLETRDAEVTEGRLPPDIFRELENAVSQKQGVKVVEGVPTYKFGIEDANRIHPDGVRQLLRFVNDPYLWDKEDPDDWPLDKERSLR